MAFIVINGTAGQDVIVGTGADEVIFGLGNNDNLYGGGGRPAQACGPRDCPGC